MGIKLACCSQECDIGHYIELAVITLNSLEARSQKGGKRSLRATRRSDNERAPATLTSQIKIVTSELFADVSQAGAPLVDPSPT
jgi:hypothetical protein